ncbi:Uncharacterised protein [Moraxella lacunata]|uniref:Uncharacterized protein n=1 Tax=Moraxella lacunata TaxID=477 RepID=A0A1V4GUY0_MORLA|nr:hypothetical protein B5J94_07725 [Moraxella lacunata]STZ00749.1 Uncharacterised protein [Moraxella lacunata]
MKIANHNIKKYKKYRFLILILALISMKILINFFDTEFKIINHTPYPIAYNNYEIIHRNYDHDFTEFEYKSYKTYYAIERNDSATVKLYRKYWFSQSPLVVSLNLRYHSQYITNENINDLIGVSFNQLPVTRHQKPHCGYKIDVYPNRKTIVTPTNKKFCIKPMYYHENFNLYATQN